jgi:hypothetical protein
MFRCVNAFSSNLTDDGLLGIHRTAGKNSVKINGETNVISSVMWFVVKYWIFSYTLLDLFYILWCETVFGIMESK